MATHHGKEGVVKAGGTGIGELTGFTLETTADVVEDTQLSDSTKSFLRIKSPTIPSASLPPGNSENKDSLTSNASGFAKM